MTVRALVLFPLAFLVACGGDADGDGLTNKEEKDLGLDKKNADTDGDGLSDGDEITNGADPFSEDSDGDGLLDGEEIANGADPMLVDTDEDTYSDFDEVNEGHDPADSADRIYSGYWPYNPDKADLGDAEFDFVPLMVDDTFPHFNNGKDQFKDRVDLYDFAGNGYIVIDGSASWCGPCQAMAGWIAEGADNDPYGYEADYATIRKAVNRGELSWVTILTDGNNGPAVFDDIKEWDDLFPNEMVPVLTDPDGAILSAVNTGPDYISWPQFLVLNKNMKVVVRGGSTDVLAFLASEL